MTEGEVWENEGRARLSRTFSFSVPERISKLPAKKPPSKGAALATKSEWPAATGHSCASTIQSSRSRSSNVTSGDPAGKRSGKKRPPNFAARCGAAEALARAVGRRWNLRRALACKTACAMLELLSERPEFLRGQRVPHTVCGFAARLRCSERTVTRSVRLIEQFPDVVRVVRVGHLEFELGPTVTAAPADSQLVTPSPGQLVTPSHPDKDHPDKSSNPEKSKTKFGLESALGGDKLSPCGPPSAMVAALEAIVRQCRILAEHVEGVIRGLAAAQPTAPAPRPVGPELVHPVAEVDAVIRQHQRLTDPRLLTRPIYAEERAVVDAALGAMGLKDPSERLALAAEVSALARADVRGKGERATLRYAFEAQPFAVRVSRLRERRAQRERAQADAALTRALRPVVQARPRPYDPVAVQRNIAVCLASMNGPSPWERAAGGMSK